MIVLAGALQQSGNICSGLEASGHPIRHIFAAPAPIPPCRTSRDLAPPSPAPGTPGHGHCRRSQRRPYEPRDAITPGGSGHLLRRCDVGPHPPGPCSLSSWRPRSPKIVPWTAFHRHPRPSQFHGPTKASPPRAAIPSTGRHSVVTQSERI